MIIITTIIIDIKNTAATEKYDKHSTRTHTSITWHSYHGIKFGPSKLMLYKKEKRAARRKKNK